MTNHITDGLSDLASLIIIIIITKTIQDESYLAVSLFSRFKTLSSNLIINVVP